MNTNIICKFLKSSLQKNCLPIFKKPENDSEDTIENTCKKLPEYPPSEYYYHLIFLPIQQGIINLENLKWPKFSDKVKVKNWKIN